MGKGSKSWQKLHLDQEIEEGLTDYDQGLIDDFQHIRPRVNEGYTLSDDFDSILKEHFA